jgi:hypothetical protein
MAKTTNPRWPQDASGPRALVECEDATIQDGLTRVLRENGYAVAVCGGPEARASRGCPLVDEGACGLVEGADVVVHALDPNDAASCAILSSIRERAPETPIVVEVGPGAAGRPDDVVDGCAQVAYPMTGQALLDAVDRAVRR